MEQPFGVRKNKQIKKIKMMKFRPLFIAITFCLMAYPSYSQDRHIISIKANEPVAEISPTMWGVFFEDINMGADGGIYAELVKNRSFEFHRPMMGWKVLQKQIAEGTILVHNRQEKNTANPRFIRVNVANISKGQLGINNEGFRGMGIKEGVGYDFSVLYRQNTAGIKLHVELVDSSGKILGASTFTPQATGKEWKKQGVNFKANSTEPKARMNIWFEGNGTIDLDMISLFPDDTWKKRPGGLRADMIQILADMKPGFIRFPGGCIVEGYDLSQRYQWKKTIGPLEERQLTINRWNFEFAHRPTPDYFQTFGLGFFEYFQLAEDIGAEPLPILNSGMACQFNTAEVVPLDQLDPYVQDALDLIEFANGSANSEWGKRRAEMGHPEPFNMKYIGIGNENWGPQYIERLKIFQKAIKDKYPDIRLVTSSGTDPSGDRFDLLNGELRKMNADIIDEHYYRRPEWFFQNAARYDNYDRNGAKIFAGEYAAQSDKTVSINNRNNWQTAIAEAAFMTGLERNAGVICMASYAPLFAHVDGWQWTPDLIWVDNLRTVGTANYQVQKLYSTNKGTHVIPALANNAALSGQDSLYASAVIDKNTNEIIIKVVNGSLSEKNTSFSIEGIKNLASQATITVLKGETPDQMNTLTSPNSISPVTSQVTLKKKQIHVRLQPFSFNVVKLAMK
jgi:alpha-L-arabinofuranosidase